MQDTETKYVGYAYQADGVFSSAMRNWVGSSFDGMPDGRMAKSKNDSAEITLAFDTTGPINARRADADFAVVNEVTKQFSDALNNASLKSAKLNSRLGSYLNSRRITVTLRLSPDAHPAAQKVVEEVDAELATPP
jgi:hypothetical protein